MLQHYPFELVESISVVPCFVWSRDLEL